MTGKKKLPVGVEFFDELMREDFYYVDKTGFIAELLNDWGKVNLFTRPRRFGKSLNMSMLQTFFEIGSDPSVFDGLQVSTEQALCEKYMGQFPVISLTLKNVEGISFEAARKALKDTIAEEARRFYFLSESQKLTEEDRKSYKALIAVGENGDLLMSDAALEKSFLKLSALLSKHYGKQVIVLIDEYDVPLDKAFQYGYYDEMAALLRCFLGNVLKTNPNLYFSVMTGCLRIAKESIFTGLNNFKVLTITDNRFAEYFGFTNCEVREMLRYYGLEQHYETVKEWYDGYRFGDTEIYCPWDVICYCDQLRANPESWPEDYWSNSSGNAIVRRFIAKADARTRDEIEQLIAGQTIKKNLSQELTYNELESSIENLWSVLFTTGYLTQRGKSDDRKFLLAIPNREIRELFVSQIREWFKESIGNNRHKLEKFCMAFLYRDTETIQKVFGDYLWNTISIRDTAVARPYKENFYHGILLGLFGVMENWLIKSNTESGIGYSDILIEAPQSRTGIVIELKYADDGNMDAACQRAMDQIKEKQYTAKLKEDGMRQILQYSIACYKKNCEVVVQE